RECITDGVKQAGSRQLLWEPIGESAMESTKIVAEAGEAVLGEREGQDKREPRPRNRRAQAGLFARRAGKRSSGGCIMLGAGELDRGPDAARIGRGAGRFLA